MFQVQAISFDYDERPLLQGISFRLAASQLLHLRGGNGSGKTTLLKLLAGILTPGQGDLLWNNRSVYDDLPAYQRQVCYAGHKPGLSPQLTVRENCMFDLHWPRCKVSLTPLLESASLIHMADTPCHQLSAGQQRRVALLRLEMSDAKLWLLDEPLVALDAAALARFSSSLQRHLARGGMVIMTSHQSLPSELGQHLEYSLT